MRLFRAAMITVLGAALSVAGCGSDQCVSGTGPTVSQTVDLSPFTGIDFQAGGEVIVVLGDSQRVMVQGQENIVDLLNRDVLNGVWAIGFTECVSQVSELRVEVTLPEVSSVTLSGAGTVEAETEADMLDTVLSGAGTITLSGQSANHEIALEGSGTIEAFDLVTDETRVILSGQGTVNVTADERLDVDLPGAGAVFYKGDPQLTVNISGAGNVVDAN